jgi:hypothetical protein
METQVGSNIMLLLSYSDLQTVKLCPASEDNQVHLHGDENS